MLKRILLLSLIFAAGCISPVDFDFSGQTQHLVVEAKFSNAPGVNYVKLSKSRSYNYPYNIFVENAEVSIRSQEGEDYTFYHEDNGYYLPPDDAIATIGHTYTLHITTAEGKAYQSEPVMLRQPVAIDSIYFEFDERMVAEKGDRKPTLKPGYRVLVNFTDPAGRGNFYRWSYHSQFEVHAQPWDHWLYACLGCPRPDPLPCCKICYIEEDDELLTVANDRLSDGRKVYGQEVFFIPFEKYLNQKHKLTLYQYSITEEAYNYFQNLEEQSKSTGSIFDPPPAEVRGNLYSLSDPEEPVLGIFDASATSTKQVTLIGLEIPYHKPRFIYPDDCRELENSTTEMPDGW